MEQLTRRTFIKFSSAALVASAATGLLSNVTRGDVTEEGAEELEGVDWNKAPCRFCGTGCSTLIGTKDGEIVSVKGDPESPVNRGLLCVKGYGLLKVQNGPDRLTDPLILATPKSDPGPPKYRKATWDEALDLIADKIGTAKKQFGPSSVAMFGSVPRQWRNSLRPNLRELPRRRWQEHQLQNRRIATVSGRHCDRQPLGIPPQSPLRPTRRVRNATSVDTGLGRSRSDRSASPRAVTGRLVVRK